VKRALVLVAVAVAVAVTLAAPTRAQPGNLSVARAVANVQSSTPQMTKALFWVDAQTSQIRRVTLFDAQGNRNDFTFSGVTVNVAVPPQTFRHP